MQDERLKILKKYVIEEPNDPFNHYALALEYRKIGDPEALEMMLKVIGTFPEYLPSYYTCGMWLGEAEQWQGALKVFERGRKLAKEQVDAKAEKELAGAIQLAKNELEEW